MKKSLLHWSLLLIIGLLLFTQVAPVFAAIGIDSELRPNNAPQGFNELALGDDAPAESKFNARSITYIIADIAVVLLQITGALAVFFIISNGFTLVRSVGEEETIAKAKKGITWALIGLVVVILSYAIVQNVLKITLTVDESEVSETPLAE